MLPSGIPSSFYFKEKHCREKPKAKCKYVVEAKLVTHHNSDEMKYKQVLIIREAPVGFKAGERQQEVSQITTCCCLDKGTSTMASEFEKNVFLPNEIVKGFVFVDNSHCTIDCSNVHFAVEQRLRINADHHHWGKKVDLVEQNMPGPGAGHGDWKREMTCDLSKIHYEVASD